MISASLRTYVVATFTLVVMYGHGQNLVPNGDFEEFSTCPDNPAQLEYASDWMKFLGTPEYMNSCSVDPWASVPWNRVGYQVPRSGEAYAGLITYSDPDWFDPPEFLREAIGVQLEEQLSPGVPVHYSFWVSPAAFGMSGTRVKWTTSGVGLKFGTGQLALQPPTLAQNDQVGGLETILSDTSAWICISGMYVPDSAYDYVVIGNFVSDSLLAIENIDPLATYGVAYVYIDDVCVSAQLGVCDIGSHIRGGTETEVWSVMPNPADDLARIAFAEPSTNGGVLQLYDPLGRCVRRWSIPGGIRLFTIELNTLTNGYYFLRTSQLTTGCELQKTLVVNH